MPEKVAIDVKTFSNLPVRRVIEKSDILQSVGYVGRDEIVKTDAEFRLNPIAKGAEASRATFHIIENPLRI